MSEVGYVTAGSATDVRSWSGLNSHILHALREAGLDIVVADNLGQPGSFLPLLKERSYRHFLRQSYLLDRDSSIAQKWSDLADHKLSHMGEAVTIISPGTIPIAYLPQKYQTVIWTDATFHSLRTTYPGFEKICRESTTSGDMIERAAFERSRLLCFSSEWAAADASKFYGVPDHKIAVIPFGANCPTAYPTEIEAQNNIQSRSLENCHLLFVGVDWFRKGGPLVVETARLLHEHGIRVRVSIVGCTPPASDSFPDYIETVGFLNKENLDDWQKWDALLRSAHFLFVPSAAECYGLVYAEASAYAIPSLARNVGGVSSVVSHGKNGFLFSSTDSADSYVDLVMKIWSDRIYYNEIAIASYREWCRRLNWRVAGQQFVGLLASSGLL